MMHGAHSHLGFFGGLKNPCCRIALLRSAGAGCTIGAPGNAAWQVLGGRERGSFSSFLAPALEHRSLHVGGCLQSPPLWW